MDELLERERELAAAEELLGRGGLLVVEGRAGVGKTALIAATCRRAAGLGRDVLRARGSELEAGFAFGVVRQLFERRVAGAGRDEREALLAGAAGAVRPLLSGDLVETPASDTSFAVRHGLYWLTATLADARPLLIAVDDVHWADEPSLRWLAYLAPRLEGPAIALVVALRPADPASTGASLTALRAEAASPLRPGLLSAGAVGAIVRAAVGRRASDGLCEAAWLATGGNPLYLGELLRAIELDDRPLAELDPAEVLAGGRGAIGRRVLARVRAVDPKRARPRAGARHARDGCEVRHAAAIAGFTMAEAMRLAAALVRAEVLAADDPPRFIHPVVRDAVEASLAGDDATVLADIAVEAGQLDEAQALLALLPQDGWAAGVGTVLIPAARARLRLAQGQAAAALADFETCAAMFSPAVWGTPMRDVGYLHARSGAAVALLRLGAREVRGSSPRTSSRTCGRSERHARSGWRCASPASRPAATTGSGCWTSRWPRSGARRRCWSALARSSSGGRRCGGRDAASQPASHSRRRSTSRPDAAPARWPLAHARSSRPRARVRDASGAPGPRRSRPASSASCAWRRRAARTARSRTSST